MWNVDTGREIRPRGAGCFLWRVEFQPISFSKGKFITKTEEPCGSTDSRQTDRPAELGSTRKGRACADSCPKCLCLSLYICLAAVPVSQPTGRPAAGPCCCLQFTRLSSLRSLGMVSPIQRGAAGVPGAGRTAGLGKRLSLKVEPPPPKDL